MTCWPTRTGLTLGRSGLVRVHELSRGNPLFALELVGENATELAADPGRSVSVPESLRRLVRRRVSPLTASARDVLLVAALSGEPSQAVVSAAAADPQGAGQDLERVVRAGVIQRRGDDLTFAHPLIRSVVADDATTAQRRATHRRLASAVRHREVRARHLALGAEGPDEHVARAVEDASVSAAARGACETAATLAELAVSLTPPDRVDDRLRRIAIEAENRFEASEPARACTLLEAVVEDMPPGPARAELLRRLARYSAFRGEPLQWMTMLNRALDESGDDQALRCTIAMDLAVAANNFGDEATARKHTALAMELAEQSGDAAVQAQLYAGMAFVGFQPGRGGPARLDRAWPVRRAAVPVGHGAAAPCRHRPRPASERRPRRGPSPLRARTRRASGEGVETELPLLLWGLIDTEAWAGNWDRAEELAAEGTELADDVRSPMGALMAAMEGLLHVYRGRTTRGASRCSCRGNGQGDQLAACRLARAQAIGLSALSVIDACHPLTAGAVHEPRAATGVTEPGLLHFLPDEIEALVRLGDLTRRTSCSSLETRSDALGRVWGVAASGRCVACCWRPVVTSAPPTRRSACPRRGPPAPDAFRARAHPAGGR